MTTRIKFFFDQAQAVATHEFLNQRAIKSFIRDRKQMDEKEAENKPFGFDLFVLNDEDADTATEIVDYEFGADWGRIEK